MLRRILVFTSYLIAALTIIGATILLVAYGQGYEFDFSTGTIVHRGLVLIGGTPSNATVTRKGSSLHKHTTYHDTFNPGTYTFTVSKDGYRSWTKTLMVAAGEVSDERYVFLLPQTLVHATLATAPVITESVTSKDHRRMAYVTPATTTESQSVWTLDLPNSQPVNRFMLPAVTDSAPQETIDLLQWSGDGSHVLIFSHNVNGPIVRVMAEDGSGLENLTTTFSENLAGLQFAPTDWHILYGLTATGELRRIDLGAGNISGVLASNVSQLSFANDQLLFVETTSLGKSLEMSPVKGTSTITTIIQSLPKSDSYVLSYSQFQGTDELVVVPSSTREATFYSGIFGSSPVSTVVARNVDHALFAPNGRFVALYSNSYLTTYDLLLSAPNHLVTKESPALGGILNGLSWADNNHFLLNLNGSEIFADFDGSNRQTLGTEAPGDIPFTSNDQKTAYALGAIVDAKQHLISTTLR